MITLSTMQRREHRVITEIILQELRHMLQSSGIFDMHTQIYDEELIPVNRQSTDTTAKYYHSSFG